MVTGMQFDKLLNARISNKSALTEALLNDSPVARCFAAHKRSV